MRVNVDDKAIGDPRFTRAGLKLKMPRFEVLGRCIPVWMHAYSNRRATMSPEDIDTLAEVRGFAKVLLAVDLATKAPGRGGLLRLRGIQERIGFLLLQDQKSAKGVAARQLNRGSSAARSSGKSSEGEIPRREHRQPPGQPAGQPDGQPYSPDQDPALSLPPDPSPDPAPEGRDSRAAEQQQQGTPAELSGWTPPAGGLADREAKRRVNAGEISNADVSACWEYCERQGVTLDARAAKLIAIQKPKKKSSRSGATEVSESDDPYLEKLDWMR
jgi:hypothetical protein